jgi:Ni,Fe-hydrogenase III large subunit
MAYAQAIEALSNTKIPKQAQLIRTIALELERVATHIGDMSALANDIGYVMGTAVFQGLRTTVINTTLSICGNRLGRGLIRPGGVNYNIDTALKKKIKENLSHVRAKVKNMAEVMFSSSMVLSRFERTGTVKKYMAEQIGLIGFAARACGLNIDARVNFPHGIYTNTPIEIQTSQTGDVYARAYLRYLETLTSIDYVFKLLDLLKTKDPIFLDIQKMDKASLTVSLAEGWRGEIAYIALTDARGHLEKVKIKDPSFNNWLGLAAAVKNGEISDFPLCNKSFNLSYCGHDL